MPLKKTAGKKAENKERGVRATARTAASKVFSESQMKGKDVHHKDGDNKNNSPGNIGMKGHSTHGASHGRGHGKRGSKNIKNK